MNCVKCGKEAEGTNVFCPECLEEMKRYPVKPGTTVQLPVRPEHPQRKQSRPRKERPPEEQITYLHKVVQVLVILTASLATTLTVVLGVLVYTLVDVAEPEQSQTPSGRNYTTTAPLGED